MSSAIRQLSLLFGKCVTPDVPNAVKVCVDRQVLDQYLLMYFKEKYMYYAENPHGIKCKPGDYVLIRKNEVEDKKITHTVEKLVYEMGNFIDPLTGRKCAGSEYIDEIERTSALFGLKPPFLAPESSEDRNGRVPGDSAEQSGPHGKA